MKKSPKKAPPHMVSRAERKHRRREARKYNRRRDDEDRKAYREGKKKIFPIEVITWILNRCDRVEVLGDHCRTCLWIFKGRLVADWSTRFATPKLNIRGFGAYREKVDVRNWRFDPESFGRNPVSVSTRKNRK